MRLVKYNQLEPNYPSAFSSLLDRVFNDSFELGQQRFVPTVDIAEDEKGYEIELSVPGIKKEDLKIDLADGRLSVSGERKRKEKKEGQNYHSQETQYGTFSRSFVLPDDIKEDEITAKYEEGILKLRLPKNEKKVLKSTIAVK